MHVSEKYPVGAGLARPVPPFFRRAGRPRRAAFHFPDLVGQRRAATGRPYEHAPEPIRRGGYHPPVWRPGERIAAPVCALAHNDRPFHQALCEVGLRQQNSSRGNPFSTLVPAPMPSDAGTHSYLPPCKAQPVESLQIPTAPVTPPPHPPTCTLRVQVGALKAPFSFGPCTARFLFGKTEKKTGGASPVPPRGDTLSSKTNKQPPGRIIRAAAIFAG